MKILLTAAGAQRSAALADCLARAAPEEREGKGQSPNKTHEIRLTERVYVETEHEFAQCGLGHDRSTNLLVRGMDAIIHAVDPVPGEDVSTQIDTATRCTYNLLMAATEEGVPRIVLLSALELMADYPDHYRVDERWRPLPRTQPPTLSAHLAEQISREFAREGKLAVTILRLGDVPTETVAAAVHGALTNASAWSIAHIGEIAL